ncbi:hypothetical protein HNR57_007083 [Streptomyces paradoxus]|uniref:Uncharacterized protein n=1 Tax=Streptomyces paradoxus TaxID=66375 RepID=A0A7W9TK59_9ACTN|nr:hypothetical protein [Streptomyces paradoxus]
MRPPTTPGGTRPRIDSATDYQYAPSKRRPPRSPAPDPRRCHEGHRRHRVSHPMANTTSRPAVTGTGQLHQQALGRHPSALVGHADRAVPNAPGDAGSRRPAGRCAHREQRPDQQPGSLQLRLHPPRAPRCAARTTPERPSPPPGSARPLPPATTATAAPCGRWNDRSPPGAHDDGQSALDRAEVALRG